MSFSTLLNFPILVGFFLLLATLAYGTYRTVRCLCHLSFWDLIYYIGHYRYAPLPDSRSIRLLRMIKGSDSKVVSYTLETVSLDNDPYYVALSYTWGLPLQDETDLNPDTKNNQMDLPYFLICDGLLFQISETLHDALDVLAGLGITWIWVDFLCINQMDLDEKASQIELMGGIYSAAVLVMVWLGNPDPSLDNFLWLHHEFFDALQAFERKHGKEHLMKQRALDLYFLLPEFGLNVPIEKWKELWKDYKQFYCRRRWFHRAWIVQEISLGRNAAMLCGNTVLPWDRMQMLARLMYLAKWYEGLSPDGKGKQSILGAEAFRLSNLTIICQTGGPESQRVVDIKNLLTEISGPASTEIRWFSFLIYLLRLVRPVLSSDDRDKIYSILGLANKFLPQGMAPPIRANYTLSTREVYVSVSSTIIQHTPWLLLLSDVEDKGLRKIIELPSWVPDFSVTYSASPLTHQAFGKAYDASLSRDTRSSHCTITGETLRVDGAAFDAVVDFMAEIDHDLRPCLDFCSRLDMIYPATKQPRTEVLWRSMVANSGGSAAGTYPAPPETGVGFRDWVRVKLASGLVELMGSGQDTSAYIASLEILNQLLPLQASSSVLPSKDEVMKHAAIMCVHYAIRQNEHQDSFRIQGQQELFTSLFQNVNADRRIYRTSQGYVGLGPTSMREGDEVWLLNGATVLFIMRKRPGEDSYTLIGETYLHGFMHGELLSAEFRNKIAPVNII